MLSSQNLAQDGVLGRALAYLTLPSPSSACGPLGLTYPLDAFPSLRLPGCVSPPAGSSQGARAHVHSASAATTALSQ